MYVYTLHTHFNESSSRSHQFVHMVDSWIIDCYTAHAWWTAGLWTVTQYTPGGQLDYRLLHSTRLVDSWIIDYYTVHAWWTAGL